MDLVKLAIPAAFILRHGPLSWRELQFGLTHELVDPRAPIELATDALVRVAEPPRALVDLAASDPDDPLRELVDELALPEAARPEHEVRDRWLYLVLAWLYDRRATLRDPLLAVEHVYADFDYPEAIAPFVRWMPSDAPDLGSREANEQRLFDRWRQYLQRGSGGEDHVRLRRPDHWQVPTRRRGPPDPQQRRRVVARARPARLDGGFSRVDTNRVALSKIDLLARGSAIVVVNRATS